MRWAPIVLALLASPSALADPGAGILAMDLGSALSGAAGALGMVAGALVALERMSGWAPWTRQVSALREESARQLAELAREHATHQVEAGRAADSRTARLGRIEQRLDAFDESSGTVRRAIFGEPPHAPGLVAVLTEIRVDMHKLREEAVGAATRHAEALRELRDAVVGARGGS